jgi:hypothetical protein
LWKRRGVGNRAPYPELLHRHDDDDDDGAIDMKEFIVSLIFGIALSFMILNIFLFYLLVAF